MSRTVVIANPRELGKGLFTGSNFGIIKTYYLQLIKVGIIGRTDYKSRLYETFINKLIYRYKTN